MTETAFPTVVSAGEALTDLVRAGEHSWTSHPGGAGWNVARACAALGLFSAFAGAVGRDVFGDELARQTKLAGLDERFLQRASTPTLLAVVHESDPPAYFFMGENSADLHFAPHLLPDGWLERIGWLHLGGISLTRLPLSGVLLDLAERAKKAGARISFDPNARVTHRDPEYLATMRHVLCLSDLIKVSDEDLRFLFPERSEAESVAWLREQNDTAPIVVTRGAAGASLFLGGEHQDFPAVPIEVADTVGAGDAFVAGLLYGAVEKAGEAWDAHVRFALRVAAAACQRAGAYAPSLEDVGRLG